MIRTAVLCGIVAGCVASAAAQTRPVPAPPEPSELEPTRFGVVYDVPETEEVTLEADVAYLQDARGTQKVDVYAPPDLAHGEKRAAVVFLNTIGDAPDAGAPKLKSWGIYRTWPRLVAAHGLVGVSMECDGTRVQECLAALFRFLALHGAEHGIDGGRLGVYAASANVSGACDFLFGPNPAPGIRAAVLYYGRPPTAALRRDLPVLFVAAESDMARSGAETEALWGQVVRQRVPWTLAFGSDLPHAFDAFADNDASRRVIQQTIVFWKSHLEDVPQPSWKPSPARRIVAAMFANDARTATALLKDWVEEHPNDREAFVQYGRFLAESARYREAGQAYERALALGDSSPMVLAGLGMVRVGESKWKDAADLLGRAVAAGIEDSRILGGLAYAQLELGQNDDAVRNYERALQLGIPPGAATCGLACFNLACGYARLGKIDLALARLGRAIDEGFKEKKVFEDDADLVKVRSDPRFVPLRARLQSP